MDVKKKIAVRVYASPNLLTAMDGDPTVTIVEVHEAGKPSELKKLPIRWIELSPIKDGIVIENQTERLHFATSDPFLESLLRWYESQVHEVSSLNEVATVQLNKCTELLKQFEDETFGDFVGRKLVKLFERKQRNGNKVC